MANTQQLNNELMEVLAKLLGQDGTIKERVGNLASAFIALSGKIEKANVVDVIPMSETSKNEIKKAGDGIAKGFNKMAKDSNAIDIAEVLGFDPTGRLVRELRKSQDNIYNNVQGVVKESRRYKHSTRGGFDIANILGAPPSINPATRFFAWRKFKSIQNDLLDKVSGVVDNIDPKEIKTQSMNLGGLFFNEKQGMGIFSRTRFNFIRYELLDKLGKYVKSLDISKMINKDSAGSLNIGRIFFNEVPAMGIFSRTRFNFIRYELLDKLSKKVDSINLETEGETINIAEVFFGESPKMGFFTRMKFNRVRYKLLDKLSKKVDSMGKEEDKKEPTVSEKFESLFKNKFDDFIWRPGQPPIKVSPEDTIVGAKSGIGEPTTSDPSHEDQKTMFEKAQPVKIAEFSDEVQEKYKKWFDGIELEQEEDTKEEEQQGFFSKLFAGLLGLLGLKAGAGGLIAGLGTKLLAIFGIKAGAGGLIGMLGGLLKKTIFGIGGVFFKGLMMLFKSPLMWPVLAGILGTAIGNKLADWQSKQRMEEAAEKGRQREGEHKRAMVIWKAMADLEMRTYMTPKTMRALRAVQEGKADEMEQRLHDTIIEQINKRREEDKKQNLKEIAPNNNLNMVKNIIENSAAQKLNDFIWRPGEAPAKISPQDTLLGAKDGIHLKEGKDIFFGIKDVSKDIMDMKTILHEDFQQLTKTLITSIKEKQTTSPPSAHLPGIPGDYGRPIHEYRTRTRGYV
jgi:hypothetical protein